MSSRAMYKLRAGTPTLGRPSKVQPKAALGRKPPVGPVVAEAVVREVHALEVVAAGAKPHSRALCWVHGLHRGPGGQRTMSLLLVGCSRCRGETPPPALSSG